MVNSFKVLDKGELKPFTIENVPTIIADTIIIQSLGIYDRKENEVFEGDFEIRQWSMPSNGTTGYSIDFYTLRGVLKFDARDFHVSKYKSEILYSNVKEFTEIDGNILTDYDLIEKYLRLINKEDLLKEVLIVGS